MREAALALRQPESSIRNAMHRLETELGCVLFIKSKKGYSFTPAGEAILAYTPQLYTDTQALLHLPDLLHQTFSHRIYLESASQFASLTATKAIANLLNRYPSAQLSLKTTDNQTVIAHLLDATAQLGILQLQEFEESSLLDQLRTKQLLAQALFHDEICFLTGPAHPLYGQNRVSLAELLASSRLIAKDRLNELMRTFFRNHGYQGSILHISNISILRKLMATTNYVSWQPLSAARTSLPIYQDHLCILHLSDFTWHSTIYCLYDPIKATFGEMMLMEALQQQFFALSSQQKEVRP